MWHTPLSENTLKDGAANDLFRYQYSDRLYLKRQNQLIGVPDIFIAATAFENKLPIATLNTGHFSRVDNLELIAE